jgi:hypothetical protein
MIYGAHTYGGVQYGGASQTGFFTGKLKTLKSLYPIQKITKAITRAITLKHHTEPRQITDRKKQFTLKAEKTTGQQRN